MFYIKFVIVFLLLIFTYGCGTTAPVNIIYWPHSLVQGEGKIKINEFTFISDKNDPKIIKTALGEYKLREKLGKIVSEAVSLEFKFAGYHVNTGSVVLDGEIKELEEKSEGSTSKWYFTITYKLSNTINKDELFKRAISIETPSNKYNSLTSFNTTIRRSFEKLATDAEFMKIIKNI